MSEFLYGRRCRVILAKPKEITAKNVFVDAVEVVDLRTQFKVSKTLDKAPNSVEITITNLAETTRTFFQGKGSKVALMVGYGNNLEQIFIGDARYINSQQHGPDWETKIEAGDGERGYLYGRVSESFRAGVKLPGVVGVLADKLGLGVGDISAVPNVQFTGGYAAFGPASRELDKALKSVGLEWSIQDGKVQVLTPSGTNTETVVVLSADTGLIGSPEYGSNEKADSSSGKGEKKPPVIKVKSLLIPSIKPGGRVQLETRLYKGLHKVLKVEHTGDTDGGNWYSEMELEVTESKG